MCSLCEVRDEPPAMLNAERLQELYHDHMEEIERIISVANNRGRAFQRATLDDIAQNVHVELARMAKNGQVIRRSWRALVRKMAANKAVDELRSRYREALYASTDAVQGSEDTPVGGARDDDPQVGFDRAEWRAMFQRKAAEVLAAQRISYPSPGDILRLMDELALRCDNRTLSRSVAVVVFEMVLDDLFPADLLTGDDLQPEYLRWLFTVRLWPETARRSPDTAKATYERNRRRGGFRLMKGQTGER